MPQYIANFKKDTWIRANSFKSTFRISIEKKKEKETVSNTISNSFDNFILADVKSTKVFRSCSGHLSEDQSFVTKYKKHWKGYVRFLR